MNITIDSETVLRIPAVFENFSLNMLLNDVNLSHIVNMSLDNFTQTHFEHNYADNSDNMINKRDPMAVVIPVTICYVIIFIAGVLGNVITCTVISRNKSMHTATNYYLFNLAISDLLLLISGMPHDTYNIWFPASYPLNQSFCILQGLLSETSTNATVLTITSFTVERYIAICHPFRQHTMSKLSRAIKFIMAIWIVAFCLAIPQAIQFGIVTQYGGRSCTVKNVLVEHAFEVSSFLFFVGPMTLICVLYVLIGIKLRKSKLLQGVKRRGCEFGRGITGQTRVIRMLIAVAVAFFLCWAPFHAQRIMAVYGKATKTTNDLFHDIYTVLTYVSGVLYFMSTCINPLLYSIMSHKFRDAFKSTLARHFGLRNDYYHKNQYSALSKCQANGSIRLTAAAAAAQAAANGGGNCIAASTIATNKFTPNIRRNSDNSIGLSQKQDTDLSLQQCKPSCKCPGHPYPRCISICSQSTMLTTVSKNDIIPTNGESLKRDSSISSNSSPFIVNGGNYKKKSSSDEKPNHHLNPLSTIAEKLRRGTKIVFLFKPSSSLPSSPNSSAATIAARAPKLLKKGNSVESAHTNTISNSSLQEVDDEEFDSAELAKHMGEINKEIR